ncbi:PSP1 domain-containing protein [Eubacterium oxidoreducens]|uniref:Cell fate regulator YaaT, PSP1 superfamily (Controls sporulation, competence, biofilm development) n=1 Tax=Eubacterium oxidoreducens TaxID=1732 RepID=A0A1G5ZZR1_EUBOX|nr:stage 0 sporulation family protein [Eubacterium oxidoreducens]SDB01647.1 Cell fate regulator YaaT, PSP1 superfamily (controls sporulation, competence, biofilm development) [Eubacterium oxidoreducens]
MVNVIGVRFRQAGKIYFFDPMDNQVTLGDHVIVETARGVEYGRVVVPNRKMADDEVVQPLKPVMRIATKQDDEKVEKNKEKEKEAFKTCKEKIRKHELEMKLVDAEYTFDNNKLLFYFTADGRIDFRELVKDLASVFRTRIELRQIGVRDETKIMGGLGICGRPMCCHTYLSDFAPVSIKMAKEQNLSLNPTKISGTCGRLMCCLRNEQETYEYLNKRLPNPGDRVLTPTGEKGEVIQINVLRQLVKIVVEHDDEREILEYPVADLKFKTRKKKKNLEQEEETEVCEEEITSAKDSNKNNKNNKTKNKNKNKNRHKNNKDKTKLTDEEKELQMLEDTDGGSKLD